MRSVLTYVNDEVFYSDICVGALSAIPRWHFARVMEARGEDGVTPRLSNALLAFRESTCQISSARNVLAEHLLNREPSSGILRMTLYGSLLREYSYLAEKKEYAYVNLFP